ncbi:MAG TPA: YCF48-related protein, partial [Planctomycetaceae bacterium]|nr:YCF48-related protein [Planctomycetaceae bacterium]
MNNRVERSPQAATAWEKRFKEEHMVCKSLLCPVFASLICVQSILWAAPRESFRYELLDDATLHDVEFVGQSGWAVGDHGTIRRTVDGGVTWKTDAAPESASLRSVCFLTDKIGWIAGGNIESFTQAARGLVLFTKDGGDHWEQLGSNALPFLHSVRFFSLEDGIAVGSPLQKFGSGLLVTHDGGRSWEDVPGYGELNWRTGTFLSNESGVVGGSQGSLAVLRGDRVITAKSPLLGNGMIHAMTLDRSLRGWMVGDEALLLKTFNGGVVWEGPKSSLPFELRGYVDFHGVAQRENHVWVAGKPGGTIWHSPDSGQSWEKQSTRNTLPIRAVKFRNEKQGWAVGEMGLILRTDNGGAVWEPVAGKNRRAAVMVIAARADQIPFAALARESGELGYRSVVVLPSEDRTGSNSNVRSRNDLQLSAAVTRLGGNSAVLGTRLPVAVPEIQRDANLLLADWNARTDGRLQEVLIRGLVAEIRMWKPDVILLSAPAPEDFVTQILNQAVLQAVQQADDPTHHLILAQETHLPSWKVRRVCQHLPDSRLGDWTYPERQWLPHVGATLADLSKEGKSIAGVARDDDLPRDSYQVLADLSGIPGQNRGGMFAGLTIPHGSESRRAMSPVTEEMLRTDVKLWEKRHNFSRIIHAELDQSRSAERTLAILDSHLASFSPAEASEHLLDLSQRMIARGDWSAAEGFLIELVNRYPDQPAAQSGMKRLISFWASEEIAWQRSRSVTNSKSKYRVNSLAVEQLLNNPIQGNFSGEIYKQANASDADQPGGPRVHPLGSAPSEFGNPSRSPEFNAIQRISHSESEDATMWRNEAYRNWLTQAGVLGVVLSRRNPNLFRSSEVQFALSAATRDPQQAADLQALYADIHGLQRGVPVDWLQPPLVQNSKTNVRSYFSKARPNLDGLLSEECWENADAIPLVRSDHNNVAANSLVMISHDAEYLYLAGTFPKQPGVKMDGPRPSGRKHDADLGGRDRLTVLFDTDRDHLTWYELSIDERGWTNESCWGNHGWNPEMYIATSA